MVSFILQPNIKGKIHCIYDRSFSIKINTDISMSSYGEHLDLADLKRCIAELKEVSTESALFAEAKANVERSCAGVFNKLTNIFPKSRQRAKERVYTFKKKNSFSLLSLVFLKS